MVPFLDLIARVGIIHPTYLFIWIMKSLLKIYQSHKKALLVLFATWALYFFLIFIRMIAYEPDGLYVGHKNVWGDWALHIGMVSIFAYKDPQYWFAYHPVYAGGKLTYPFLVNFISGMLVRVGFSMEMAFIIPSLIYVFFLLTGMYAVFYIVLKSKKQTLVAIFIFFLSAGLGFINFLRDFSNNPSLKMLLYPEQEYSNAIPYEVYSGNFVVGMLIPQRAFLLGMALSLWIMTGLVYILLNRKQAIGNRRILFVLGTLAGLLPIIHIHSFIVIIVVTGSLCLISYERWKELLFYAVPAIIISIFLYLMFISGGIENPQFFQWLPGWTSTGGLIGWLKMWIQLWGIMLPIAVFGFFLLRKQPLIIKTFFFSFFLLFILANFFLFQPMRFDNTKIFMWAYLGFSGLAAVTLSWGWRRGGRTFSRFDVVLMAIVLTFTGSLELIRLQRIDRNQVQLASAEDIKLGAEIREKTDPLAIFLTSTNHNHPVMMWGARSILMGYPGWVFTYGFLYQQREKDVAVMFKGGAEAEKLLKQYKISYVAIGPSELKNLQANESYYAQNYPVAIQNQNYRIYDVRKLGLNSNGEQQLNARGKDWRGNY
ncbi:hypothetical protein NDA00_06745 [Funiculus sociatus GB2-M2]|uniref:hypothetical protein n=2 Tax=Cyanophyceae TaxID=3028117 RepID=UPI00168A0A4A|nr:hypothetical protein [Trichocoleus sp. FACHB-90]